MFLTKRLYPFSIHYNKSKTVIKNNLEINLEMQFPELTVSNFKSSLREHLFDVIIPQQKLSYIQKCLESDENDYQSLLCIIDTLVSLQKDDPGEKIRKLLADIHY